MRSLTRFCVFASTLALVAGCTTDTNSANNQPTHEQSVPLTGLDTTAEIDAEHSTVTLPYDRFKITEWEQEQISQATSLAISVCANEKLGIKLYRSRNWDSPPPETLMFSDFGPWTSAMADTFGFVPPMTKGELSANDIIPPPKNKEAIDEMVASNLPTDGELERALGICGEGSSNADFNSFRDFEMNLYSGPWHEELLATQSQALSDPETLKVNDELVACYQEQGLSVATKPREGYSREGILNLYVEGLDSRKIDEQQVTMANQAVECKQQTQAIERIATVWAEKQAPIIEKYADEIIAYRNEIDSMLSKATQYINDHEDLLLPDIELEW